MTQPFPPTDVDPESLARLFHETYERLAPDFGYRTREASAKPWSEVPEQNRALMIATCAAVIGALARAGQPPAANFVCVDGDNDAWPDGDLVDFLEQVIHARLVVGEGVRGAARSVLAVLAVLAEAGLTEDTTEGDVS